MDFKHFTHSKYFAYMVSTVPNYSTSQNRSSSQTSNMQFLPVLKIGLCGGRNRQCPERIRHEKEIKCYFSRSQSDGVGIFEWPNSLNQTKKSLYWNTILTVTKNSLVLLVRRFKYFFSSLT
ncbi:hypothetical protein HELRODRAFT_166946 [Helobdella robusta]|uniref:Uncharacterized protein n=1 Tax=Helobdella robusta TaxID=6412 RepID=T1EYS7_HELRO|nr:hypothetical protein HELRODRAFT_166946 [Helobdella robusta]ESO11869.1 hypothetical protein HELRODRAFT_166946 [Helobdella robusta]